MTGEQLRKACDHYGVPRARALTDMITNLVEALGTNIGAIVSADGPWTCGQWNDICQQLGGARRRSFEEVVVELRGLLAEPGPPPVPTDGSPGGRTGTRRPPRPQDTVAGRYVILEKIGDGGFAAAFRAQDSELPRSPPVVLKLAHDDERATSFINEMEKALRLDHPNICRYRHYGSCPTFGHYLVMDDGGQSAQAFLRTRQRGEPAWVVRVGRRAARGLDYAHSRNVVHGDVNPGNILLDAEGSVRITDFGIAATVRAVTRRGGGHTRIGTNVRGIHPKYSAPEIGGDAPPRPASDQYSLALVMLELLMGEQVNRGSILDLTAHLPAGWKGPFMKALAAVPSLRHPTCSAFVAALPTK